MVKGLNVFGKLVFKRFFTMTWQRLFVNISKSKYFTFYFEFYTWDFFSSFSLNLLIRRLRWYSWISNFEYLIWLFKFGLFLIGLNRFKTYLLFCSHFLWFGKAYLRLLNISYHACRLLRCFTHILWANFWAFKWCNTVLIV